MNTNFQYTALPSASQIGEQSSYLAFKACKAVKSNLGLALAGFAFGFVAIPISIAFTPIAIVADIIVGIAEAIFIAYKGAERKDVQELLFKKIIVSPVQQILSFTVKTLIFLTWPMFWPLAYSCSKKIIRILPDCLNHKRMNIFINDGASSQMPSKATMPRVIASASPINNPHASPEYLQFKKNILNKASARTIFGFGNERFTQSDLSKRYKQLALIVHPDKNHDLQKEAQSLFVSLKTAYSELQPLAFRYTMQ